MAFEITWTSDRTNGVEKAKGSDNRLNVSSRSDGRSYYNSRDESLAFSALWDDSSSEAGDFILSWKNTDATGKVLVIHRIQTNSENTDGSFKLHLVDGDAIGASVTPVCLNRSKPKTAQAICKEAAGTPLTGLISDLEIDHVSNGDEMSSDDLFRVGQDQTVAIEYEQGTTGRTWGKIIGYYE